MSKYQIGKHWKIKDTSKMKGMHNSPNTEFKKGHKIIIPIPSMKLQKPSNF